MSASCFEAGKYYRWTGSKIDPNDYDRVCGITILGPMTIMTDGKAHLCIASEKKTIAAFEGIEGGMWCWPLAMFEEVPAPVTEFKAGHWYVYHGHDRPDGWNSDGLMDGVLDNQPHHCITGSRKCAMFDCTQGRTETWSWMDGIENWEEVPEPRQGLVYTVMSSATRSGVSYPQLAGRFQRPKSEDDPVIDRAVFNEIKNCRDSVLSRLSLE